MAKNQIESFSKISASKKAQIYYADIYSRLTDLALGRFRWIGIDEETEEFIERVLHYEGSVLNYNDKTRGNIFIRYNASGTMNFMDNPTSFMTCGVGIESVTLPRNECVIIKNNRRGRPTAQTLQLYAHRLALILVSADINNVNTRVQYIFPSDAKQKLTVQNIADSLVIGEPYQIVDKNLDIDRFKPQSTGVQYLQGELLADYNTIWNDALTFLGLNNANTDKRERLITSEVESNNETISTNMQVALHTRQKACEEIKKKFGKDITVEFVGGDCDGTIHNDSVRLEEK